MTKNSERFLLDSASFITPYSFYYPFDLAQTFWDQLLEKIVSRDIIILDVVKEELIKGDDDLSKWIESIDRDLILNRRDADIITNYRKILGHVQTSGLYSEKALKTWSQAHIADPWLIASALTYGYTVVSFEKPNNGLNIRNKSGNAKIPDVCKTFGVQYKDLFNMMRSLSFSFNG